MKAVAALLAFLAAVFPHPTQALPQNTTQGARPDQVAILDVPATAPWTDTGINVRTGDRIDIRAWGTVKFGGPQSGNSASPDGSGPSEGGCTYAVTDSKVAAHSLIGNVASQLTFDGHGFYVGSMWAGTLPIVGSTATGGRLFLGFNDSAMSCDRTGYDSWAFRVGNSGSFTIELAIRRAR